jgi:hypothetical protein
MWLSVRTEQRPEWTGLYGLWGPVEMHPRHRMELSSLECNDAQGTSDRVGLGVNEVLLWGAETMRSHDVEESGTLSPTFHPLAEVGLRETRGQGWSRAFTLVPGE